MAIIEIIGGPVTHKYLMGKTKDEIATLYMRLLRETERDAKDADRYRWLRQRMFVKRNSGCPDRYGLDEFLLAEGIDESDDALYIDAAIDAEMGLTPNAGG